MAGYSPGVIYKPTTRRMTKQLRDIHAGPTRYEIRRCLKRSLSFDKQNGSSTATDALLKAEINALVLAEKQVRLKERFQHPAHVSLPAIGTFNRSVLLQHEDFTSQSGVAPPTPQAFSFAIIYENDAKTTGNSVDELSFIAT
ncbi:hypothetical protein CMUS01_07905 [Colletotrichum musicola]|uniref:Uncharacterized protein n=1 Tax=Colletotrichum musicola TaxID=2175873 RepID=A0A8H6NEM7_9PEZI|nr:hypothetical protein CMUS01_07905 [Colletotrichum musicola]